MSAEPIHNINEYDLISSKIKKFDSGAKRILLIQPLQIAEDKIDIRIALNKRYYIYPPYALGILNSVLKNNNYVSDILDLNIDVFTELHSKKLKIKKEDLTKNERKTFQKD